jgi:hypothetical protein
MRPFVLRALALCLPTSVVFGASPQYLTPNTGSGPTNSTLGSFTFVNKGLQGVGRIDASLRDQIGDTFGSVSAMQVGNWSRSGDQYNGTFYTLPDRGRNDPAVNLFYDYAGRIQTVPFTFTPYTGAVPLGGTTVAEKRDAQNQIVATYQSSTPFSYANPLSGGALTGTTGLNPGSFTSTLFGQPIPLAPFQTINSVNVPVNKLALDAEGLILLPDGSGYVSDEYGPYVYRFDSSKQITGILGLPEALKPHTAAGSINFDSLAAPSNGRRNNQGMEGIALSPDGTKLFALLQSATVQDTNGSQQQTRNNTRLAVYDLSGNPVPTAPSAMHALQLPILNVDGSGAAANRTAAQSEIVALSNSTILVLARDGNGYGTSPPSPAPVVKSVFMYDITGATNFAGDSTLNAAGGQISPAGALSASITPAANAEVLNLLNQSELAKFNLNLNMAAPDELTFSEKWEGMSLVSALDPANPDDYFLFVANDNDFATTNGFMKLADGTFEAYSAGLNNDTVFLAYRVTVIPEPGAALALGCAVLGLSIVRRRAR